MSVDVATRDEVGPVRAGECESLAATGVAQGTFIGHLIHELRNLLAPMGNVAQLIRLHSAEDTRLAPATAMLDRQIASVGRLLEKLATADHLLRPDVTLDCTPLDLRAILTQAVDANRETLVRRPRELTLRLPESAVTIAGSAPHLAAVMNDLIDNAGRYTRDGGRIGVELDVVNGMARLRVRDDGRGIAADRLPHVFTPRCLSPLGPHDDRAGLGLSLATAARVLALHGGSISAASAGPGAGSEFTLLLPLCAAVAACAPASHETPTSDRAPPCRRVLIVDDNDAMQDSLTHMLVALGQQVRSARDGEEAVRIAGDWQPNLVLLDINLPKMNGYRVAQTLRTRFPPAHMALVMMAGDELIDAVRRGAAAVGVDRCVDKLEIGTLLPQLVAAAPCGPEAQFEVRASRKPE